MLGDGWTQPIVVRPSGQIVDGHHRYYVASEHPDELQRDGKVPVVEIDHETEEEQRISTIRHNRARGAHDVESMAENISHILTNSDMGEGELADELGMEMEEIRRLKTALDLPTEYEGDEYEREWKPE
jgi:ParB-like chromosome segregation protein Spo0J